MSVVVRGFLSSFAFPLVHFGLALSCGSLPATYTCYARCCLFGAVHEALDVGGCEGFLSSYATSAPALGLLLSCESLSATLYLLCTVLFIWAVHAAFDVGGCEGVLSSPRLRRL